MGSSHLDAEGRVKLPDDVRNALGWKPGQELLLQIEDGMLVVQPLTPASSLKEEARRLASTMRDLATATVRQAADGLAGLTHAATEPAAGDRPAVSHPGAHIGAFGDRRPRIPESAYLAPGAAVIGDVTLGEDVSLWPGVVLRGDVGAVRIGDRSNVQEGAVLHQSAQADVVLGAGVTVGHQATVHACTVGDDTLIGIHAVVLDGATIGRHCLIAAGAVVAPGTVIPDGKLVMGVPGRVVRDLTPQEIERVHWHADSYVSLKNQYRAPAAPPAPEPPRTTIKPAPPEPGVLPRYECRRAAGPIEVDGALDDPGWAGVSPMSALQHATGARAPTQPTEVRACWDDRCLYLAYACRDTDIWASYKQRDEPLYEEEVVEFFLAPADLQHYFEFEVSPLNTLFDAKVFSPEGHRGTMLVDAEWNASGIRTAVRVSGSVNMRNSPDIGWNVEVALPFADLGLDRAPAPGTVWRANFYRIERGAATEFTAWSPTFKEPADFHVPACFGELVFVGE